MRQVQYPHLSEDERKRETQKPKIRKQVKAAGSRKVFVNGLRRCKSRSPTLDRKGQHTVLNANNLLTDCIEEIPKYLAKLHSTPETIWSEVEGAKEYHTKLERKKQQDPEKHGNHTWRDDRIEATRRAWERWRCCRKNFTYLSLAARLVVLISITSTSVERVFSQVKFIMKQSEREGFKRHSSFV
eukprot:scaffold3408_cov154-Skeletonema_menzelii.AAC.1